MIAITVVAATGLAALVTELPRPQKETEVDLAVTVEKGALGWGSGDEFVKVVHRGGETLSDAQTTIVVRLGATTNRYTAATLGGPFADGRFAIGEIWTKTYTIQDDQFVDVDVLLSGDETEQLAATTTLETPCSDDLSPPTVSAWEQTPADVDVATAGAVVVKATLVDDCSGVDASVAPGLQYRVYDAIAWNSPPIAMSLVSGTWQASIPDPMWANYGLKTLEYKVTGMADDRGNVGASEVRSDVVNPAPTYFDTVTANVGTVTNFNNAQSASDAGAEAELKEAATGNSPVASDRYATSQVSSGVTDPGNAIGSPNDNHAIVPGNNNWLRVGGFSQALGTITKVELGFEGKTSGTRTDDSLKFSYRISAVTGSTSKTFVPGTTDGQRYVDVTSDRTTGPSPPGWTWQNVVDLEVQSDWVKNGSEDALDFLVDAQWLRVTYTETVYNMSIRTTFAAVPDGPNGEELQLKYRVSADTFRVQVWNGTAWNTRGTDLISATSTTWSYGLTAAEYNGGAPRVRFIDVTPNGAQQGFLYLDYGRVRVG